MFGMMKRLGLADIQAAVKAALKAARLAKPSRNGHLSAHYPTDSNGQYRNPERAAKRRRVRSMGGRRQYLMTTKALKRFGADLSRGGAK